MTTDDVDELGDFESKLEAYDEENESEELHELHVGDHVTPDGREATAVVVEKVFDRVAREYPVKNGTVADYHPDEYATDAVYLVSFANRTDVDMRPLERYAYPRGVLTLEAPVHSPGGGDD